MPFCQRLKPDFFQSLQADMRARMIDAGLDILIVDHYQDVGYTTGFSHYPSERPVAFALTRDGAWLLVPELEREYAGEQKAAAELAVYFEFPGVERPFEILARATGALKGRGGYGPSMETRRTREVQAAFPDVVFGESDIVEQMRLIKRPEEVVLHREASRISDEMVRAGADLVRDAIRNNATLPTEAELASFVGGHGVKMMHAEHSDIFIMPSMAGGLVYGGANSAFPHGMPSGYRLRRGESFMLSLGCAVGGRFAESERTFILGEPTADQRRYYEVTAKAQHEGTEAMIAGKPCHLPNTVALDIIRDAGLGEYIRHRLGHGIGMGNHEPPWIEGGDETLMAPGMILSSEPAVYVPGVAGFRVSDTVLVTDGAPERLTRYPRDLADMVID